MIYLTQKVNRDIKNLNKILKNKALKDKDIEEIYDKYLEPSSLWPIIFLLSILLAISILYFISV